MPGSIINSRIPIQSTATAACLHRLSTGLCTGWLDTSRKVTQDCPSRRRESQNCKQTKQALSPSQSPQGLPPPTKGANLWNQPATNRAMTRDGGAHARVPPPSARVRRTPHHPRPGRPVPRPSRGHPGRRACAEPMGKTIERRSVISWPAPAQATRRLPAHSPPTNPAHPQNPTCGHCAPALRAGALLACPDAPRALHGPFLTSPPHHENPGRRGQEQQQSASGQTSRAKTKDQNRNPEPVSSACGLHLPRSARHPPVQPAVMRARKSTRAPVPGGS
jgi:hypothetical protein